MKARIFPNIDEEIEADVHHTWNIDDWKGLPTRVHGPVFESNGFSFRILLFPEGNRADSVSVYLEAAPVGDKDKPEQQQQQQQPPGETQAEAQARAVAQNNAELEGRQVIDSVETALAAAAAVEPESDNDWALCAQFGLVMWNPNDPSLYHSMFAQHRYNPDEGDWGFTKFYDLRRLFTRHNDKDRAIIEGNQVNITAYVRIIKDPTGVLWHNFYKYNSKKETGYVGLKNQGATCYLNSLLQSLYFTKVFRRSVYKIPTQDDLPTSVPSALQRLFYLLNTSDAPVGTLQLTKSFGWDSADAFTQHDVQELNRVLMDKLEGKMKGTEVEGALNNIFVAQMKSYVKCVNVDFESSRIEDFWDIQLNVKGMKDIEESFRDYIQTEMLNGENQYQATGYGLQDATKGVVFQSFPPVLHLQLKRYEYDFNRDMEIKINDRYEFPLEMDLSPYLEEGSDMSESWTYQLHGVLVHSGDLNAGHYYALLKPSKDGSWYKFDDDRVTKATIKEVLEENFGGEALPPQQPPGIIQQQTPQRNSRLNYKRHSSAYMLVYLRKSRLDEILPADEDVIPEHIPKRLEMEAAEENARRKEREEQHFYMNVRIMSKFQFVNYQGFDIGNWDLRDNNIFINDESRPISYKILKTTLVSDFLKLLLKSFGEPQGNDISRLQLWLLVNRQNKTFRLDRIVGVEEYANTMDHLRDISVTNFQDFRLWLEVLPSPSSSLVTEEEKQSLAALQTATGGPQKSILIFLKYFNKQDQTLKGIGTFKTDQNNKVLTVVKYINQLMNWDPSTRLTLVEEIKPEMIDSIKISATFNDCEISDGDVICFEKDLQPVQENGYVNSIQFYDFLSYRTLFVFKKRSSHYEDASSLANSNGNIVINSNDDVNAISTTPPPPDGSFELWLNRKDSYDQLALKVAQHLNVQPTHLQFFTTQLNGYERAPVKRVHGNLQQLLIPSYTNQYSPVTVLYEILDISLEEFETKRFFTIIWLTDGLSQEHKHDILISKTSDANIQDILDILKERTNIGEEIFSKVKVWGSIGGRVHRIYTAGYPIQSISDEVTVYASITPAEEYVYLRSDPTPTNQKLIYVYHFQKDPNRTHSTPFTFLLKAGEPFSQTKVRLQKILGVYDKVFEKIKFAIIKSDARPHYLSNDQQQPNATTTFEDDANNNNNSNTNIDINDIELFSIMGDSDYLGLDHTDKSTRRAYGQQAIFIKS